MTVNVSKRVRETSRRCY